MEKIFYIAQLLGALNTFVTVIYVFAIVAIILLGMVYFGGELYDPDNDENGALVCKKWLKNSAIITIVAVLIAIFVPDKQTYLFMVGGRAMEEISNSEKVQDRASKTIDLLDQYLERKVKEIDNK